MTRCQPQLAGRTAAAHRRSVPPASLPLCSLQRHARPLPPCRAMDDSDGEEGEQQQRQQQRQAVQQAAPAQEEQQQESEVAVAASSTAAAADASSGAKRQQRAAVAAPAPPPPAAEPDMGQAWKMGLGGVVALAAFAGLGFLGHRLFKSKAVSSAVTNVQQVRGGGAGSGAAGRGGKVVCRLQQAPARRGRQSLWLVQRALCVLCCAALLSTPQPAAAAAAVNLPAAAAGCRCFIVKLSLCPFNPPHRASSGGSCRRSLAPAWTAS